VTNPDDTGPSAAVVAAGAPGQWPRTPHVDALLRQLRHEHARRALVLDSIRANLEEQPSPWTVRACARDWVADLLAIAETVAKNMEHPK
jgi:hypothetical protein